MSAATQILTTTPANVPPDRVMDIDMYNPPGIEHGYHAAWKRLQSPGVPELIWTPRNGGHWIATRGALIRDVYRDPGNFSSHVIFLPKEAGEKYDMIPTRMDPPEHTPFRTVLNRALGATVIRRIEPAVRRMAAELVETLVAAGHCDFSAEFAQIFPIQVFMALADLPMQDAGKLQYFAAQMTRPDGETPGEMAESLDRANKGFLDYVAPIVDARRGSLREDVISVLVNSQIDDRDMTKQEAGALIALLLLAGLDTVVNFLSFVMQFLGENAEQRRELAHNPTQIPQNVEELLRRFPLVAEARMVAADLSRDGVDLKAGDMVLLPTVLSGLDERENADPLRVDFARRECKHATFGDGPHRCAGMLLARLEIIVTLQEWLKRIPEFEIAEGTTMICRSGIVAAVENLQLRWNPADRPAMAGSGVLNRVGG